MAKIPTTVRNTAGNSGRARVILADDNAGILRAISRTLEPDFDVVASTTDGREALDMVARLDPDIVVLDISMPGLSGFEAAEELKRSGSRAKIVFLTMHDDDEFIVQAMRCGATGYVLKTLASSELTAALHHALSGRQHLPSLAPLVMTDSDSHAVQFRGDDSCWLDNAANVLSRALRRGDTIASALIGSNRDALALRMQERGWNPDDLEQQGRYLVFDAEVLATQVMRSGMPGIDAISELVAAVESARSASGASHLTLIGEIAAVLCRRGSTEAALELERLWDELTRPLPILTICTYPTGCFDRAVNPGFVSAVCAHHSIVNHAVTA